MFEKIKSLLPKKKVDYKALYEEQVKMREAWEFRYNKLRRQVEEALSD